MEAVRPDVVLTCAAYNAVDRAESEPELAFQVNSEGAFNVAAACRGAAIRRVHFSTNFVFDGTLERPYNSSLERPLTKAELKAVLSRGGYLEQGAA